MNDTLAQTNTNRLFITLALYDACHNEPWTLQGLLDYLMHERGYSLDRLALFAQRRFGINWHCFAVTMDKLFDCLQ